MQRNKNKQRELFTSKNLQVLLIPVATVRHCLLLLLTLKKAAHFLMRAVFLTVIISVKKYSDFYSRATSKFIPSDSSVFRVQALGYQSVGLIQKVFVLLKSIPKSAYVLPLAVITLFAFNLILLTLSPQSASAAINEQMHFQGRLRTSSQAIVADGDYNIRFKIYSGGDGNLGGSDETLEWTETYDSTNQLRVENGYFAAQLGSLTSLSSVDFTNDTLWLSIDIGGTSGTPSWDGEMDPFIRLSATPYAFEASNSDTVDGLHGSDLGQLAANQTWTGANIFQPATDATTAFQIKDADGGTPVLNVDTTNERVGVGTASPGAKVHVSAGNVLLDNDFALQAKNSTGTIQQLLKLSSADAVVVGGQSTVLQLFTNSSEKVRIASDGKVGIGDTSPAALLTVGATDAFQVDSNGAIQAATGITASGTITFSALTSCDSIDTDASGVLSCGSDAVGVTTVGTIDSQTKSVNGAVISGDTVYLQNADATYPGLVSVGAQTFAGAKTFSGNLITEGNTTIGNAAADTLTVNATSTFNGDLTVAATNTITFSDLTNCDTIDTDANGVLSCGTDDNGSGTRRIRLHAEYENTVLDAGTGVDNTGTMTSRLDLTNRMNYYKWTTAESTNQSYDVVVQVPIPNDFDSFASNPIRISTYSSDLTNGTITFELRDSSNTVQLNFVDVTPSTVDTWETADPGAITGTFTAGDYMTLRIRMQSPQSGDVRIGNIYMDYTSN